MTSTDDLHYLSQSTLDITSPSTLIAIGLSLLILYLYLKNKIKKNIFTDPSLVLLIASNLISVFFAIRDGWQISTVMLVYWFQSIIIGFFNFVRILQLKNYSTIGFKINGQSTSPTQGTKVFTAFFFLFHYGFFHVGYLTFILTRSQINPAQYQSILLMALLFFVNHLFSYIYNKPNDKEQNIGTLMARPYSRIVPMHITIVFGAFLGAAVLPFFLILKIIPDVLMHIKEHHLTIPNSAL